jgi:ornithine cyclodeaminase
MQLITAKDVAGKLSWQKVIAALEDGHRLPKAQIADQFLGGTDKTLLSRSAWIDGLGFGVKSVSVFAGNTAAGLPSVQGAMLVFEDTTGTLQAVIDSSLITNWKTAADSVLGAKLLARPNSKSLLVIGAGSVAKNLVRAYCAAFAKLVQISIWNRTPRRAAELAANLAKEGYDVTVVNDLATACQAADIITTATMARTPVLRGDWISPGTHVDLIGAFKADMREADDTVLQRSRLFVDSYDTTLEHIGELMIPLASGAITKADILADLYGLMTGATGRQHANEITVFKNGGGAHLDLMVAHYILRCVS